MRIIYFDANNLKEDTISALNEIKSFQNEDTVTWLNIDGLHNTKIMEEIASVLGFDKLVMAEVLNTEARSRIIKLYLTKPYYNFSI